MQRDQLRVAAKQRVVAGAAREIAVRPRLERDRPVRRSADPRLLLGWIDDEARDGAAREARDEHEQAESKVHQPEDPRIVVRERGSVNSAADLSLAHDHGRADRRRRPVADRQATRRPSKLRGDELAAQVLNGLIARHDLDPGEIEDVQLGCVTQIGEQGWNIGRMIPLVAGWPETVCGTSVDRQCGSSMQANFNAAAAVWSGQLDVVVSAGVEMMSRVPMGSNGGDLSRSCSTSGRSFGRESRPR